MPMLTPNCKLIIIIIIILFIYLLELNIFQLSPTYCIIEIFGHQIVGTQLSGDTRSLSQGEQHDDDDDDGQKC